MYLEVNTQSGCGDSTTHQLSSDSDERKYVFRALSVYILSIGSYSTQSSPVK